MEQQAKEIAAGIGKYKVTTAPEALTCYSYDFYRFSFFKRTSKQTQ
ncbi:hypothetical protein [Desulfolucanica intricata]|nr:hypothetical protein [Desulfolucanica intricata]